MAAEIVVKSESAGRANQTFLCRQTAASDKGVFVGVHGSSRSARKGRDSLWLAIGRRSRYITECSSDLPNVP